MQWALSYAQFLFNEGKHTKSFSSAMITFIAKKINKKGSSYREMWLLNINVKILVKIVPSPIGECLTINHI